MRVAVAVGVGVGVRVAVGVGVGVGVRVGVGVADCVGVGVGVATAACETDSVMLPEAPPKPPAWIQYSWSGGSAENCTSEVEPTVSSLQVCSARFPWETV